MTANVRCAGGGLPRPDLPLRTRVIHQGEGSVKGWTFKIAEPCGWEGERFATGHVTRREADTLPIAELQARVLANQNTLRTAKPCPRCGGRVELIPNGGDVA